MGINIEGYNIHTYYIRRVDETPYVSHNVGNCVHNMDVTND